MPVSPKNTLGMKRARRKKGEEEKRNCTLGLNLYSGCPLARSPMCPKNVAVITRVFCTKNVWRLLPGGQKRWSFYAPINVMPAGGVGGGRQGMGWGFDFFQKFATKFPAHGQIIPVKCNQISPPQAEHCCQSQGRIQERHN